MAPRETNEPTARGGILIVGHGTRDQRGCVEFAQLVERARVLAPSLVVEGCFLELAVPDIAAGIRRAVERGARWLAVVPLLLVSAGHAKTDIPRQIAAAAACYPEISIWQTPHLGAHEAVLQLAHRRYCESLASRAPVPPEETLLLVVGRGTNDPEANVELCQFARRRWEQTRVGRMEVCFLAMTEPSLDDMLRIVAELPFPRIVVEPHFLLAGQLLDRVNALAAQAALRWPKREFVVCARLGPDNLLADAIVELSQRGPSTAALQPVGTKITGLQ